MRKIIKYIRVGLAGIVLLFLQACGGEETYIYQKPDVDDNVDNNVTNDVDDNVTDTNINSNWQLVWFDEFSDNSIDTSKWGWLTDCWGGGNNELQCYTDRSDNSYISDGRLIIEAKQETFTGPAEPVDWNTNPGDRTLHYTSARLRTKDKGDWKYGRIEIRAKLPYGQGIWPAIWMMPTDEIYGGWAASGEIDIMEAINLNKNSVNHTIHGTIHFGGEYPANTYTGSHLVLQNSNPTTKFHTYTIEWAEDKILWYVDDVHYGTKTSDVWYTHNPSGGSFAPFDQRFHLILNVAVGGNWPGAPNANTQFPQKMEIDYVRVFSCPDSPNTLTACQ